MALSSTPSIDQLKRALEIAEKIKTLEAELESLFSGGAPKPAKRGRPSLASKIVESATVVKKVKNKKRNLSPEARERIAAAQRTRWANNKKA